jgi:hypothetical protein
MVGFQWIGGESEGLNDPEFAVSLGAAWEADELVTYDLDYLRHNLLHHPTAISRILIKAGGPCESPASQRNDLR